MKYTDTQIEALAAKAAADYAAACSGPTIRGRNGEKNLRGSSLKEVADKNGISVEEAKLVTVDLATATWSELSPHWQSVNIDSARGMIALMQELGGEQVILNADLSYCSAEAFELGAKLHAAWLQQESNSWAIGGDLDKPFSELPWSEQKKDIQQLRSLQEWLREMQ